LNRIGRGAIRGHFFASPLRPLAAYEASSEIGQTQHGARPPPRHRKEIGMTARIFRSLASTIATAALLAGCGGGGGGDTSSTASSAVPPVASTSSFPLATGYQTLISGGENNNFNVSGSCAGTATITTSAATTAATFEGVTGFSAGQTSSISFSNCLPATSTTSGTSYYNGGYLPIGFAIAGGEYDVATAAPTAIPASVVVSDSGTIVTLTSYTDSSKATVTGKRVISYQIEADTSTTAIANIITRSYNTSDQLLSTQQSRYRMAASGTLALVSIDVQFSTNSTVHLVYTVK
jgi:hypothetical protein